jgi:hypothetical protein
MASGHVNRVNRPNTWLHRPMLQNVKKALANSEPSTHRNGPQAIVCHLVANGGKADMAGEARFGSDWHQPDRARCVKTMFLHGQDP